MKTTRTLNALNDTRTVTPNKYMWGEFTPDVEGVGYKDLPVQTELDTSTATLAVDTQGPTLVSITLNTLKKLLATTIPVSTIQPILTNSIPNGWLLCDGTAVSRTDYADLFEVIGTTYGSGDGETTFNLPDCRGLFLKGKESLDTLGVINEPGLPNITGQATSFRDTSASGAFSVVSTPNTGAAEHFVGRGSDQSLTFDASRSSSIYGNSNTVTPRNLPVNYIIKY